MDEEARGGLVQQVTEAALRGEFERVAHLDAPEWPPLPDYLAGATWTGAASTPGPAPSATRRTCS